MARGCVALDPCLADVDPSPMTRQGSRALVERFHAMQALEDGAGGPAARVGATTLPSLGPRKTKSDFIWTVA